MEFIVKEFQTPIAPEFNFEELKAWVEERTEVYKNMVYSDDQISAAKQDRANLNRVKKMISDRRIELKKQYLEPFDEFEAKINEICSLIDEPAKLIDQRVKEFEEAKKQKKTEEIEAYFAELPRPTWLTIAMIWNPKWLNATFAMKKVKEEIDAALAGIEQDIQTLNEIPEFGFEATEEYKRALDINRALAEGRRLSEIQKRKAEEEARRAEAERQAKLDAIINNPTSQIINRAEAREEMERQQAEEAARMPAPEPQDEPVVYPEPAEWVRFEALITEKQGRKLGEFCRAHGIQIRPAR